MKYYAYAKINLRLEIENKLSNGYHTLHMVNARVKLADEMLIKESVENKVTFSDEKLNMLQNNMCFNILEEITKSKNIKKRFDIYIKKNIPQGAGLGGGSSDAAAIINFLDSYCDLKLTNEEKVAIGLKYGADVPYCLFNDIAYVSGIGEKITFLRNELKSKIILIYPSMFLSTKNVFEHVTKYTKPTPLDELEKMIEEKDFNLLLYNDLEQAAFKVMPTLKTFKEELKEYGYVVMSGSGSTFIVIPNNEQAASKIKSKYQNFLVVETEII